MANYKILKLECPSCHQEFEADISKSDIRCKNMSCRHRFSRIDKDKAIRGANAKLRSLNSEKSVLIQEIDDQKIENLEILEQKDKFSDDVEIIEYDEDISIDDLDCFGATSNNLTHANYSHVNSEINLPKSWNYNGKTFAIGDEKEAIMYIYRSNLVRHVFKSNSKEFVDEFDKLLRIYCKNYDISYEDFMKQVNEFKVKLDRKELFLCIFVILTHQLIISDVGHSVYTFTNPTDLATRISDENDDLLFIIKNHRLATFIFLSGDDYSKYNSYLYDDGLYNQINDRLMKLIFDFSSQPTNSRDSKVMYIEVNKDVNKILKLGTYRQFISSLIIKENMYEKNRCIYAIDSNYHNVLMPNNLVENEFKELFHLKIEDINLFLDNLCYYCTQSEIIHLPNGMIITNSEQDLLDLVKDYKKSNAAEIRVKIAIYYSLYRNKVFAIGNFSNISAYLDQLHCDNDDFDAFIEKISKNLSISKLFFDGEYRSLDEIAMRVTQMSLDEAIAAAEQFNNGQLKELFKMYNLDLNENNLNDEIERGLRI
ncbi:MAG: hypothetical protein J1F32_00720 [Erysipelotrichales bacterium]|nr:hypothetical protein [Erysipelotrichales bacterium]